MMADPKVKPDLEFIVSTPTDDASQREDTKTLVRRHVMKPHTKNKRGSRSILLQGDALASYLSHRRPNESVASRQSSPVNDALVLGAARVNPFARYPITVDLKDEELIHHIWSPSQVSFQPFRDYWFPLGLIDGAAMHMVLSNAAIHLNKLRNRVSEDISILAHNAAAMRSVNARMGNDRLNISNEIVGAILGLMCHEHLTFHYERCLLHMAGFQRVLAMRGGLNSIETNSEIRLSLYWIEYNIAIDQDIVPNYPPPYHLIKTPYHALPRSASLAHCQSLIELCGITSLVSPEMLDILSDLSRITLSLKYESWDSPVWGDSDWAGFGIYPVSYKLLSIQARPEEDPTKNFIQEVCRLAGLLYLNELRRRFGVAPIVNKTQAGKLKELLMSNRLKWQDELEVLRLWALVIVGCALDTKPEREWVVEELIITQSSRPHHQWDHIIGVVSKLWWVKDVFLPRSEELGSDYEESIFALREDDRELK